MASFTAAEKHDAYTELKQLFSEQTADVVMRGLRLDDDDQLVTKADLRATKAELLAATAELRGELRTTTGGLRGELRTTTGGLRGELRTGMADLRTEMANLEVRIIARLDKANARQTVLMVSILIAVIGAMMSMRFGV